MVCVQIIFLLLHFVTFSWHIFVINCLSAFSEDRNTQIDILYFYVFKSLELE